MKCPHCAKSIHLQISHETAYFGTPDFVERGSRSSAPGFDIAHGFCPACERLIVLLRTGTVQPGQFEYGDSLDEPETQRVLYPFTARCRSLAPEIPHEFKNDFGEAEQVLPVSAKASAAISRRLLQHILHQVYEIRKKNLSAEIDEFLSRPGVPAYLSESLDAVRNVGNFAAHPSKGETTGSIIEVEPGEAEWLLEVIEALFDYAFVQPIRLQRRRDSLNSKLAAAGKPPMK